MAAALVRGSVRFLVPHRVACELLERKLNIYNY